MKIRRLFFMLWPLCVSPVWPDDTEIPLSYCLSIALEHNENIIKARQRLVELGEVKQALKARFLPTINIEGQYHLPERDDPQMPFLNDEVVLRASQRVLEFGTDNQDEIDYRAQRRKALLDYDRLVRQIQSDIRRNFFLAVLKTRQISSRKAVLEIVKKKLHRIRVKYTRGVAKEFDLLTAQLDSLEQEEKITSLLSKQQNLVFNVLPLSGMALSTTVALRYEPQTFDFGIGEAVAYAIAHDVELKSLTTEFEEARREYHETDFAYFPDLGFEVGFKSGDVITGFALSKKTNTQMWHMDFSSEVLLSQTGAFSLDTRFDDRKTNRFAAFQFTVPIFDGFQRNARCNAARARLGQACAALEDQRMLVEHNVRTAYQILQEQKQQEQVDTQRLEIARRRLDIQERLQDLGLATDIQVETFRNQFFQAQDRLFQSQDAYVGAWEDLRKAMGYFE